MVRDDARCSCEECHNLRQLFLSTCTVLRRAVEAAQRAGLAAAVPVRQPLPQQQQQRQRPQQQQPPQQKPLVRELQQPLPQQTAGRSSLLAPPPAGVAAVGGASRAQHTGQVKQAPLGPPMRQAGTAASQQPPKATRQPPPPPFQPRQVQSQPPPPPRQQQQQQQPRVAPAPDPRSQLLEAMHNEVGGWLADFKGRHAKGGQGSCSVCDASRGTKELAVDVENPGGEAALCEEFLAAAAKERSAFLVPPTQVRVCAACFALAQRRLSC